MPQPGKLSIASSIAQTLPYCFRNPFEILPAPLHPPKLCEGTCRTCSSVSKAPSIASLLGSCHLYCCSTSTAAVEQLSQQTASKQVSTGRHIRPSPHSNRPQTSGLRPCCLDCYQLLPRDDNNTDRKMMTTRVEHISTVAAAQGV